MQDEGSRELGAVVKYFQGQVLIVATWKMEGFACPQTADASALLKTTELALDRCFKFVVLENDCKALNRKCKFS